MHNRIRLGGTNVGSHDQKSYCEQDGQTDPDWIALDLFSQAEHDEDAQSVLVSPDRAFLDRVAERIAVLLPDQPRREIIACSLSHRGAFIATFTNTYAALPMALTGALSGKRAARRVNETASFFAVTTLPGALDRYGPGFEAAAMVRLMHSMVRYNALKRSDKWDAAIYGMPAYSMQGGRADPDDRRVETFRERARSGVSIYGTAYLWTAGLMNLLLLFDVWDVGRRRRG